MNNDPLANMRDIHLAEPISQFPMAMGWWISLLLLLMVVVIIAKLTIRLLQRRRIQRHLMNEIEQLAAQDNWPMQIMILMKRVAMTHLPACDIQALSGDEWINWMTKLIPEKEASAFSSDMKTLAKNQYQRTHEELVLTQYQRLAKQWIVSALNHSRKKQYASLLTSDQGNSGEASDV